MEEQIATESANVAPVQPLNSTNTTVYVNSGESKSNGVGTTGFVFSILTIFLGWIPILGWIFWFLGALLSFIGVFKSPKGLSIAGLVISFFGLILILALAGIILAAIGMS